MPKGIEILRRKVPRALVDLVLWMLEKDPGRRLSTLGDAIDLLRDFCSGVEVPKLGIKPRFFLVPAIRRWLPLLFTVFLGLVMYVGSEPSVSDRQLRVFLAQPEYYREGKGIPMEAVIWSSVVNGLHLLGSIQPILYQRRPVDGSDPAQLAKLVGSDEWINIQFQPENPLGNVQLQRIRTGDGILLKQVQFSVPNEHLSQSAQAALSQILALYGDVESRQSIGYSTLSYSDYSRFVEIYSSLNQGVGDRQVLFDKLDGLVSETPGFFAAEVMAVDLAHDLFSDTDEAFYLERAKNIVGRLQFTHPNPMVVLQRKALLSIDSGDIDVAEKILDKIAEMSPGDPEVLLLRSRIAEYRGDISEAIGFITKSSNMASISWGDWYRAAALAIRIGDVNTARDKISKILELTPGNTLALGQRGLLELLYGDVDRAITIYKRLLGIKKHRSYFVNLGLALMLKEDYQGARENFTYALEEQPGHRVAMLNLADAEMALGNREAALGLYRIILNQEKPRGDENAYGKMVRAQCLAHLEEYGMAIELTLEALSNSPEDSEIAYQAALIYTLVGEYKSAIVNARAALRRGMDRRWFNLPVFQNTPVPDSLPKNNKSH